MNILFTVLCALLLLLIFIICRKCTFTIQFYGGILTVKIGKIKVFTTEKREKEKKYIKIPKLSFRDIQRNVLALKQIYTDEKHEIISVLQEIERKLDIKLFNLSIIFGFGDAAVTAIANGFIWSGISFALPIIKRYVNIENKTNIAVDPHYTETCFSVDSCFIFETRIIKVFGVMKRVRQLYIRNACKFAK